MFILITGAGGMLGKYVYGAMSKENTCVATDIDLNESWIQKLDVTNEHDWDNYDYEGQVTHVFHLAAKTDMEYCEDNPTDAWLTNAMGVENAVKFCKRNRADLIYISTAGIFDNEGQESFNDYDFPSPRSIYGKSKYRGELIAQSYENHYVFRAGWMMGGRDKDKKFVGKVLNQIMSGVDTIHAVDDKFGTPTYAEDLAYLMSSIVDKGRYGTYNAVCRGECSRFDVAQAIVDILKLDIDVIPVNSDYFEKDYYAPRPVSEKLTNLKLEALGYRTRYWQECLNEYLRGYEV